MNPIRLLFELATALGIVVMVCTCMMIAGSALVALVQWCRR